MNGKFIYACGIESRDELLKRGYQLLKTNEDKQVYVFLNSAENNTLNFDLEGCKGTYAISDVLTF